MAEEPHVIRERAEAARAAIAADVDALGDKLNVRKQASSMKDEMVDKVKGTMGMDGGGGRVAEETNAVFTAVREHPMAALMAGVGLQQIVSAWRREHARHEHGSSDGVAVVGPGPVVQQPQGGTSSLEAHMQEQSSSEEDQGSKKERAKERLSDAGDQVKERKDQLQERAQETGQQLREQVSSVTSKVPSDRREAEQAVRSNIGVFGIGAFALGALAGLFLPRTRMEQEQLGSLREDAMHAVKDKAETAKHAAEAGLDEAVSSGTSAAKDELQSSGESASSEQEQEAPHRPGPILGSRGEQLTTPTVRTDEPVR